MTAELAPLHCLAISDKRYALFNIDRKGRPVIRKASAHGLGHLPAPYHEDDAPNAIPNPVVSLDKDIGVERWQYDFWYQIVCAELEGHPERVDLVYHPALDGPAASRYGATTPTLLKWFDKYNRNRPYSDQVRPFNFMLAFQVKSAAEILDCDFTATINKHGKRRRDVKPVAPYDTDIEKAARRCFDRATGDPVSVDQLKTYREALKGYHLHPETKFLNGEYLSRGPTSRRHVEVIAINHIGKEANRWEEQYYLSLDIDAQINYGLGPEGTTRFRVGLREASKKFGQRELSSTMGITRKTLSDLLHRKKLLISKALEGRFLRAIATLSAGFQEFEFRRAAVFERVETEIMLVG